MPLTRFKKGETVIKDDLANSWFGGLYGSQGSELLDPNDPLVAGHVHDGLHLDGHAQKIHLDNHTTGQLNGSNIVDSSIGPEKLEETISDGGGEDLSETLVLGNITGGSDIVISSGDKISGKDASGVGPSNGGPVFIRAGIGGPGGRTGSIYSSLGNPRGSSSIDLQSRIDLPSYIAESDFSSIIGGYNNKVNKPTAVGHYDSYFQTIIGGSNNIIFHEYTSRSSGIIGGYNNNIGYNSVTTNKQDGSIFSQIIGGFDNKINNYSRGSRIIGGKNCYIGKNYPGNIFFNESAFVTGVNNITTHNPFLEGAYSSFTMGYNNLNYGSEAGFINGRDCAAYFQSCTITGNNNKAGGGAIFMWGKNLSTIHASGTDQTTDHIVMIGSNAYVNVHNKNAFSCHSEPSLASGGAQRTFLTRSALTTNAVTETLNNSSGSTLASTSSFIVSPNSAYFIKMYASAIQNDGVAGTIGDSATWEITAVVKRGTTPASVSIASSVGTGAPSINDAGAATWTLVLDTNTTDGGIKIRVTGEASKTIVWSAGMYISEVRGTSI